MKVLHAILDRQGLDAAIAMMGQPVAVGIAGGKRLRS